MTRTSEDAARPRTGWPVRVAVLGPAAIAALATAAVFATNTGMDHLGPLWMAALAWTVLASLAGALARRFRHRDWSAFGHYELPDGREEQMDWITKTGMYAYLRDEEDRRRHDDDYLR